MVVVNYMLLDRYWPCVGPQEALFTCILRRVAERNGGGEQRAAGTLLAACRTPGDALYLYTVQGGRREWW
jgi:hypothetical protein